MRVLFSTTAGAGHFGPQVPIARACVEAGDAVAVAAPASFSSSVAAAGLDHLAFPDVAEEQMGRVFARLPALPREDANRLVIGEVFGRLDAQAALPTLLALLVDWQPDIVVRDPCEFGALAVAERLGLPQVQVAIGVGRFLEQAADWLDEPLRELEALAGLAERRGAERVLTTPTLSSVPRVLDGPRAGSAGRRGRVWRYRVPDLPVTGPSLPGEWGEPAAPLVYVTFGSVAGSVPHFSSVYPAILEILADAPVRVLLTTGSGYDPSRLGALPANAWAMSWWPQAAAMQDAALVIGHGGFGTTMAALAAGVPQLVMPLFASDQFLNAEQVEAVGAGRRLEGGLESMGEVPALVRELLEEPRFTEAARGVAAEMAGLPDIGGTVTILHDLAHRRVSAH